MSKPLLSVLFTLTYALKVHGLAHLTMSAFRNRLPASQLGESHSHDDAFIQAASKHKYCPAQTKEFTLVIVTASPCHILLGKKNRGFGKGMWNSFGGKLELHESPEVGASRELLEETNIQISSRTMRESKVGVLRYTFAEDPVEMMMHLYHIHMPQKDCSAYVAIRGCDEITPHWVDDWHDIPLGEMFADDSHWLVTILSRVGRQPPEINGRFHFVKNCQETNTILHYFLDVKDKEPNAVPGNDDSHIKDEFRHRLPLSRLGTSHPTLDRFLQVVAMHDYQLSMSKEYTLVVVTASPRHILLGYKNRGFGEGMYNSFGGKVEPGEDPDEGASRELLEETNINVSSNSMRTCKVGILRFTSESDPLEMIIHLYRVHMPQQDCPLYSNIQGCEEITPKWFNDWRDIPLDTMFADDSRWLITLLSSPAGSLEINGSFHFKKNLFETNTILHYFMEVKNNNSMAG
jgi:8-oxo-dGTP pyrophosphatase MutT (NUDIX family)